MARQFADACERKLAQAYTRLITNHPFFASILLRLERVRDPIRPTMWTDGKRLGYNPKFVEKITDDEVVGVLAHEVCHVAALHPFRRQQRNPKGWNVACDKVVNHIVKEARLELPEGCIPPVPDKSAEELYIDDPEGDEAGGGTEWAFGEVIDPSNADGSGLTEAQLDEAMEEARIMVTQAATAAKRAGKLPAGLERLVEETLDPKVPWKELLSRFVDGNYRNDYSWSRPNRRYSAYKFVFPSLYSPGYGLIAMACDTSGSIDQATLVQICSEVLGCLEVYASQGEQPELTVLWCDTQVTAQQVSDASDLKPTGGGGTSFAPVMDWIKENEVPKALVYVTDGYCGDFGDEPACPVLWVLTQPNAAFKPPFGEITCILNT